MANESDLPQKAKKEKAGKSDSKKEKAPDPPPPAKLGRGVETLYRTSFQMQMGLTSLADGKASIMISVNSLALTVVVAAGGLVIVSEPLLLLPISVFLLSSLSAMLFGVLATRPQLPKRDVTAKEFMDGDANILFFNNFPVVTEDEFVETMDNMIVDRDGVYQQMARTTHGVGLSLVRKFRLLRISFTIFTYGLALSILLFLGVFGYLAMRGSTEEAPSAVSAAPSNAVAPGATTPPPSANPQVLPEFSSFAKFRNVFEPSAVHQLSDGRFLVVEDEARHPMDLLSLNADGTFSEHALFPQMRFDLQGAAGEFRDLKDLEALDVDARGNIYAITSFSRTREGSVVAGRERFARFRVEGNAIADPIVVSDLKERMIEKHPILRDAAGFASGKSESALSIEGLAFDEKKERLFVGFRSPVPEGKALVMTIENPIGIFERGETPVVSDELTAINLKGGGIRGMTFDPRMGGFLILSRETQKKFRIWFWDGAGHTAHRVRVIGMKDLQNAEGITPVSWHGQDRLLIVSDDGDMTSGVPGQYVLLNYEQLVVE